MRFESARHMRLVVLALIPFIFACQDENLQKPENWANELGHGIFSRRDKDESHDNNSKSEDGSSSMADDGDEFEDEERSGKHSDDGSSEREGQGNQYGDAAPLARPMPNGGLREGEQSQAGIGREGEAASNPSGQDEESLKAMLKAGKVMTTVVISDANPELDPKASALTWFTSQERPIKLYVAVEANGQVPFFGLLRSRQIASGTVAEPSDPAFSQLLAPLATLHSSLRVCNKSGKTLQLNASRGSPFGFGLAPIGDGLCAQVIVEKAEFTVGSAYDRSGGQQHPIYFKVIKVSRDGKILP